MGPEGNIISMHETVAWGNIFFDVIIATLFHLDSPGLKGLPCPLCWPKFLLLFTPL